ncbi:MAG: ABC transporter ATP-binding protein [Proteobacteria bacterium]|nr:ABC transporter ATP-binding protein [Pseudomonadota bacterium]
MIRFENVSYQYPFQTQKALDSVSFAISEGEAVLFTGVSGSGKSTLIRLINGLAPHYYHGQVSGQVLVNGHDNATRDINRIADDVGTLFQDAEQQFFALSVEDELAFAHECRGVGPDKIKKTIEEVVDRFFLERVVDSAIFDLSEGEKQKVALASIVSLKPGIIILDEPSANLDPEATAELATTLDKLKEQGITIVVVDHRLYWLSGLIDSVFVLQGGRIVESGDFSILENDTKRVNHGLRKTQIRDSRKDLPHVREADTTAIEIADLTFAYRNKRLLFDHAYITLPVGEVVAIVGENGAGKTTFARLLTGLTRMHSGDIRMNGAVLKPRALLKKGSIVLQNTDHQLHMKTVRAELEIAAKGLPESERNRRVREIMQHFNLDELALRHPQSLSAGQKQRLVIACGMIKNPDVLILDEPTSGLDGLNMKIISDKLKQLAGLGVCVLVITHDLELIEEACGYQLRLPLNMEI